MLYINDGPEAKCICAEIVKLYGIVLLASAPKICFTVLVIECFIKMMGQKPNASVLK